MVCSTAKERDDAAKAMTTIKRLTILTMLRRTELDCIGSILPSRFAIACGAAAMKARFAAHPRAVDSH